MLTKQILEKGYKPGFYTRDGQQDKHILRLFPQVEGKSSRKRVGKGHVPVGDGLKKDIEMYRTVDTRGVSLPTGSTRTVGRR